MPANKRTGEFEARVKEAEQCIGQILSASEEILLGKKKSLQIAIACMIAQGNLLIEDIPGVGKTILAHLLARVFGLSFQRIQFTSDLLPSDILGFSIYNRQTDRLKFQPGPIFAQLVLADEINRSTPKTQSALLEAMEERQVSIEGKTRDLPHPFFLIATQNPFFQIGTFPLPESQIDRFTMSMQLGYPDTAAERDLLRGQDRRQLLHALKPIATVENLIALQKLARDIHVSDALLDYLQQIILHTRESPDYTHGLSPRAGVSILQCAQAWALSNRRTMALPEDIQAILPYVASHRLQYREGGGSKDSKEEAVRALLEAVPIP